MIPSLERSKTILIGALLWVFNVVLMFPLFFGEYTQFTGSIEPAFLTDARFIVANFPNIGWDPFWYGGFPFHLAYPPLVPFLIAIINQASVGLISIPSAYRILIALAHSITPALFYFFVFYLTRKVTAAIVAAAFYSLFPAYVPNQQFPTAPVSLTLLTIYGEGPHIIGLALVPVCAILFLRALRRPSYRKYVVVSVTIALVFLTDLVAAFGLAVVLVVLFSSELFFGKYRTKAVKSMLVCALLAAGLVAFWYNLSFLDASLSFGGGPDTFGPALLVVLASVAIYIALFRGKTKWANSFISLSWTTIFLVFTTSYFIFNTTIAPQPFRYFPELLMGLAILIGLTLSSVFDFFSKRVRRSVTRGASIAVIFCILILVSIFTIPSTWQMTAPNRNFTQGPEYQIAQWLASHDASGARIFASGSQAFWLNVFSNVPQLKGGSDQAAISVKWWEPVNYLILGGANANLSVLWLQALNVQYVILDSQSAPLPYHDYLNSTEFQGLLALRYLSNGTYIYEVPLANPRLAAVVNSVALYEIGPVSTLSDAGRLSSYIRVVSAVTTPVEIENPNPDTVILNTFLQNSSEGIVVKMNYDPAWRATIDGRSLSISMDPVGFMLLLPGIAGNVTIILNYNYITGDVLVGYVVTSLTIATIGGLLLLSSFRSSSERKIRHP